MIHIEDPWFDLRVESLEYYKGRTNIHRKKRTALVDGKVKELNKALSNAQVSSGFCYTLVNQRVNHFLNRTMHIVQLRDIHSATPGPSLHEDLEDKIFGRLSEQLKKFWIPSVLRPIVRDAIIGGYVYVYPSKDQYGRVRITHFPAWEITEYVNDLGEICAVVRTANGLQEIYTADGVIRQRYNTHGTVSEAAISDGTNPKQVVGTWDVIGKYDYTSFDIGDTELKGLISQIGIDLGKKNYFGREPVAISPSIPLYKVCANDLGVPILHNIKHLIDLYDGIASDWLDTTLQYPGGGILVVKNSDELDIAPELLAQTRIFRVQNTAEEPGGGLEVVNFQSQTEPVLKQLAYLRSMIFEAGGGFDEKGDYAKSNLREEVIRAMQATLRASTSILVDNIQLMIRGITHLIFPASRACEWKLTFDDVDYRSDEEITNLMVALNMKVSNRTLLENYPLVSDVAEEMRRIREESTGVDEPRTADTGSPNGGGKPEDLIPAIRNRSHMPPDMS